MSYDPEHPFDLTKDNAEAIVEKFYEAVTLYCNDEKPLDIFKGMSLADRTAFGVAGVIYTVNILKLYCAFWREVQSDALSPSEFWAFVRRTEEAWKLGIGPEVDE